MTETAAPTAADQPVTATVPDPTDLGSIRRILAESDRDGRLRPIGMNAVRIAQDAIDALPGIVRPLASSGLTIVLTDATAMRRGSEDLKPRIVAALGGIGEVRHAVIGSAGADLHADELALAEADAAIAGAACVVSVGSGTVTDIAKDATHRAGGIPLVVVQTAVSVNAFSDDMAVLLRNGVKRTVPSRWPDELVVDLPVIAGAPAEMNRAGFGELASMFTAPADWYLAGALGMDAGWHPAPVALFRSQGEALLAAAARIRASEPDALGLLARLMTLSGMAIGVAGTSAPLSGTEHIISHLLDMAAERSGRALNYHGAQVGVASVVMAVAWHETLDTFHPSSVDVDAAYPAAVDVRATVGDAFRGLDVDGGVADECWRDVGRKLDRWAAARPRFEAFLTEWPRHRDVLRSIVVEPAVLAMALRASGAPACFSDLDHAVSDGLAHWAFLSAPLMRDRFVLADLRARTGSWTAGDVDRLLASTAAIGVR